MVSKKRSNPFNKDPQTPEKYWDNFAKPSAPEPTDDTGIDAVGDDGTSDKPLESSLPINPRRNYKKGQRRKKKPWKVFWEKYWHFIVVVLTLVPVLSVLLENAASHSKIKDDLAAVNQLLVAGQVENRSNFDRINTASTQLLERVNFILDAINSKMATVDKKRNK